MRKNKIIGGGHGKGGGGGVHMCDWAIGFMKDNELREASGSAIVVGEGADPEVSDNTISECAHYPRCGER